MYYSLHEASYQVATEKLYEWYEYNKKIRNLESWNLYGEDFNKCCNSYRRR